MTIMKGLQSSKFKMDIFQGSY